MSKNEQVLCMFLNHGLTQIHTDFVWPQKAQGDSSQLGVLDTAYAPNVVCVLVPASRPQGRCIGLICKLAETGALPAGGEVMVTTDLSATLYGGLGGFAQYQQ